VRPIGDWSMSIDLVEEFEPSMRSCGAGMFARAVELARQRLVERLDHSVDLPPPETPVTQVKVPSGISP
jgi:hypothetical protein